MPGQINQEIEHLSNSVAIHKTQKNLTQCTTTAPLSSHLRTNIGRTECLTQRPERLGRLNCRSLLCLAQFCKVLI